MKLWKKIWLRGVFIGFEKRDDEELYARNKKTKVRFNDMVIERLRDLKIQVWASFIIDPAYGKEDFRKISTYLVSRGIKTPTFSVFTLLHGTKLYEDLKSEITSFDFDLFDIAHSVLPTKLDLEDFYKEFCNLYKISYFSPCLIWEGIKAYLSGKFKLSELFGMLFSEKNSKTIDTTLRLTELISGKFFSS